MTSSGLFTHMVTIMERVCVCVYSHVRRHLSDEKIQINCVTNSILVVYTFKAYIYVLATLIIEILCLIN